MKTIDETDIIKVWEDLGEETYHAGDIVKRLGIYGSGGRITSIDLEGERDNKEFNINFIGKDNKGYFNGKYRLGKGIMDFEDKGKLNNGQSNYQTLINFFENGN